MGIFDNAKDTDQILESVWQNDIQAEAKRLAEEKKKAKELQTGIKIQSLSMSALLAEIYETPEDSKDRLNEEFDKIQKDVKKTVEEERLKNGKKEIISRHPDPIIKDGY